ncbi:MAG: thioredoxin [Bacteroidota bacterium]
MPRLSLLVLLVAGCATAQTPPAVEAGIPTTDPVRPSDVAPVVGPEAAERTATETAVAETIAQEGVHVVRLWAPWCGNSRAELEGGVWRDLVEAHPDVTFSFVTIWSDGRDGAEMLRRFGVSEGVAVYAQPDRGPSANRSLRRTTFLGLPLSWTPTTWIFNRGGKLAYAFNYGEVNAEQIAQAIDDANDPWAHD